MDQPSIPNYYEGHHYDEVALFQLTCEDALLESPRLQEVLLPFESLRIEGEIGQGEKDHRHTHRGNSIGVALWLIYHTYFSLFAWQKVGPDPPLAHAAEESSS